MTLLFRAPRQTVTTVMIQTFKRARADRGQADHTVVGQLADVVCHRWWFGVDDRGGADHLDANGGEAQTNELEEAKIRRSISQYSILFV